jgi:hypothetical protein
LKPCRLSDPFCFTDKECYCKLANGTFGAACPMYGSCLGACCSTTGVCPDRMGHEDAVTGQQSVLLPKTCADWGLNEGGAGASAQQGVECRLPKGRGCVVGQEGGLCMGYTACKEGACGSSQQAGAMCVYNKQDNSKQQFDVCTCLPVY